MPIYSLPTIGIATVTDADWGRLYNFDTTGDAGLIMPFRSYYFRDFFAGSWTTLAMGLIFATNGDSGDESAIENEIKAPTIPNLFHFGISQSVAAAIDVENNPYFIGIRGTRNGSPQIAAGSKQLFDNQFARVFQSDELTTGNGFHLPITDGIDATPFAMMGIKFIYNRDTQTIYLNYDTDGAVALADEDANITTLTDFLDGISDDTGSPDASFALPNLSPYKSYYIYWPYELNHLKLHCVGAIKY